MTEFSVEDIRTHFKERNLPLELLQDGHLFILVRHRGCTFCRESLTNLAKYLAKIQEKSLSPVIVHMGDEISSELILKEFGLEGVSIVADPDRALYTFFGARRGGFQEVLGPEVLKKGVMSGALFKYGIGKIEGDSFQLGAVYLIKNQQIHLLHRPENAADVENWPILLRKL